MSDQLRLILLGTPQFFLNDQPLTDFNSNKTRALLIYLALNRRPLMRTTLAGLFWGDMPEKKAHTNLRKSIANLNKMVGDWLTMTRQTAFFTNTDCWIDVQAFEAAGMGETAVSLYGGEFLEGFYIDDAPEFEQWLLGWRARLREQMLGALYNSIQTQTEQQNVVQAIAYCQQLLSMEAWREETHQQLMRLYVRNGQRSNALAQFAQCKQLLWDELGVTPASETEKLAERIQNRPSPAHNLNSSSLPFIGRADEIADLQKELLNPACHLLTILGHGGIGKTRLAQAVAATLTDHFLEGVWWVELADVDHGELLPHAIGAALGLHFAPASPADVQIIEYLRSRELLLILDNMEHLVETADFLAQLLQSAPNLTLLLTSRREIQLQEEQIWMIEGLPYPADSDTIDDPTRFPALTLFESVVRRRQRHFRLNGDTPVVSQICRLVEGSPLAIELAASATHHTNPATIANQLQANLDSLQTEWRNTPKRHHSLRAVFDHSWALLNPSAQDAFRQLAIFHGPFSADAVTKITQMDVAQLHDLVANSLLRPIDNTQFSPHELLRQFALELLQTDIKRYAELSDHHADYYLDFVAQHGLRISTADSFLAQQQIVANFTNIVAAWRWHTAHRADDVPLKALRGWLDYFLLTGNAPHGVILFEQLCAGVDEERPLATHLQTALADLEVVTGRVSSAEARLAQVRQSAEWQQSPELQLHALTITISLYIKQGKSEAIAALGQEAKLLLSAQPATRLELILLNQLATTQRRQGHYDAALEAFAHLHERASALDNRYHEAVALMQTAVLQHHYLDNYLAAKPLYEQALAIAQPLGFKTIMADCHAYLGSIYSLQGEQQRSLDFLQHALQLYRDLGEPITEGLTLINMCHTYDAMDEYTEIGRRCRQGINLLAQAGVSYYEADCRALCSSYAIAVGEFMTAQEYLQTALAIARDSGNKMLLARVLWRHVWLTASVGDFETAVATLKEAQDLPDVQLSTERACGIALSAALLYQYQGKLTAALQAAQQASTFAHDLAPYWEANCAIQQGYILLEMERWTEATAQFAITERIRTGVRQLEAQAGLALATYRLGDRNKATAHIQPLLTHLQMPRKQLHGAWQATAVYLNAYDLLPGEEFADHLVKMGNEQLQQQWRRLDTHWQATFWHVPTHQRLKRLGE